jgi:Mycobacterium 19 kDa lipoprotein antigen
LIDAVEFSDACGRTVRKGISAGDLRKPALVHAVCHSLQAGMPRLDEEGICGGHMTGGFIVSAAAAVVVIGGMAGCSTAHAKSATLTVAGKDYPMEGVSCKAEGGVVKISAGKSLSGSGPITGTGFGAEVVEGNPLRSQNVVAMYDGDYLWVVDSQVTKDGKTYTFSGQGTHAWDRSMDQKPFKVVVPCP